MKREFEDFTGLYFLRAKNFFARKKDKGLLENDRGQEDTYRRDDEQEKWYFSIVDVVGVLTGQSDIEHARNYWKVLTHRLKKRGMSRLQIVTN